MSADAPHSPDRLTQVMEALLAFREERDWAQFHTPANLAKSVSIEAGELLECFQWGGQPDIAAVEDELADVLTYCLYLAHAIGVDPLEAVATKLETTAAKYPADLARGRSTKYDRLSD